MTLQLIFPFSLISVDKSGLILDSTWLKINLFFNCLLHRLVKLQIILTFTLSIDFYYTGIKLPPLPAIIAGRLEWCCSLFIFFFFTTYDKANCDWNNIILTWPTIDTTSISTNHNVVPTIVNIYMENLSWNTNIIYVWSVYVCISKMKIWNFSLKKVGGG